MNYEIVMTDYDDEERSGDYGDMTMVKIKVT